MDDEKRQMMLNQVRLATKLKPKEKISREDLIDILAQPLPDVDESEATLRHAYRHLILNRGLDNANAVVSYEEAAKLSGTTVDALRAAASRGKLVLLGAVDEFSDRRKRTGMTLRSLAEYKKWNLKELEAAARKVAKWRENE